MAQTTQQKKLKEEFDELKKRFEKLIAFLNDDNKTRTLPIVKLTLMQEQAEAMAKYLDVLAKRTELELNVRVVDWKNKEESIGK